MDPINLLIVEDDRDLLGMLDELARARQYRTHVASTLADARRAVDIFTRIGSPNLENANATLRECQT